MFKPCFHVHHVWKQKFGFFILLGPSCGTLHLTYYSLIKYFKLCWAVVTLLCYCVKVLQCGDPERSNVVKLNKTQWKQEKTKSQCFWWENNATKKQNATKTMLKEKEPPVWEPLLCCWLMLQQFLFNVYWGGKCTCSKLGGRKVYISDGIPCIPSEIYIYYSNFKWSLDFFLMFILETNPGAAVWFRILNTSSSSILLKDKQMNALNWKTRTWQMLPLSWVMNAVDPLDRPFLLPPLTSPPCPLLSENTTACECAGWTVCI